MRRPRLRVPALAVVLAAAVAVLGVALTTGGASAATRRPACTQKALQAAVAHTRTLRVVKPFGCDGGWAYAAVLIGTGRHQVEGTSVFTARGSRWVAVSRERPCARHQIPKRIYKSACDSN